MKIHYKKSDIFVPEWNDNKKLPEGDQIKFHHKFLTTVERKTFIYWKDRTEGQMAALSVIADIENMTQEEQYKVLERDDRALVQNAEGIARAIVTKIENLEMEDEEGKVQKIDTIAKFYNAPDAYPALRAELEALCLRLSARADSKNS